MRKKGVFIVATQYDNVGDLLINKCLINELSKYIDLYLDSKNVPTAFRDKLLDNTNNVFLLEEITDYSFKGKGSFSIFLSNLKIDYIFKSPGPFGSGGNKSAFFKNAFFGVIFLLFSLKGVKSFLIGNDILNKHWLDRLWLKLFGNAVEKIFGRSFANVSQLKGLKMKNIEYSPDMCFGMQVSHVKQFSERRTIGISFRDLGSEENNNNIIQSISVLVNFWLKKDFEIVFFYQVDRDKQYTRELFRKFDGIKNVSFLDECLLWENIEIYNSFSLVLSNRLHVILLGLVFGAIPIGILNDDLKTLKIHEIFNSVKLDSLLFEKIELIDLEHLYNDLDRVSNNIRMVANEQKNILERNIEGLFK